MTYIVHVNKILWADNVTGPINEANIVAISNVQHSRPRIKALYIKSNQI